MLSVRCDFRNHRVVKMFYQPLCHLAVGAWYFTVIVQNAKSQQRTIAGILDQVQQQYSSYMLGYAEKLVTQNEIRDNRGGYVLYFRGKPQQELDSEQKALVGEIESFIKNSLNKR